MTSTYRSCTWQECIQIANEQKIDLVLLDVLAPARMVT